MSTPVHISQTHIKQGGVLRCCLASVATEYVDNAQPVKEGDTSACKHCGNKFTLRRPIKGKMIWFPDEFEFDPASP